MAVYILPFAMSALLAVLYEMKVLRFTRGFYGFALLVLALFAGLRFEVGQDWPAYKEFFEDLGDASDSRFEIGYYWLNYVVKWLGGSYSTVFLIASLFCAYAVYRLTSRFKVNRFYILTIYISYSFLILNFAQVRQAIALSFFLLGFNYYLRTERPFRAALIMLLGPLFQYSAMMYIVLFVGMLVWQRVTRINFWMRVALFTALIPIVLILSRLDFYSALAFVAANVSTAEKIEIYREFQTERGTGQVIYAAYLATLAFYFWRYIRAMPKEQTAILRFAIITATLTILFVFIFPGSYAMYSRAYVLSCIFHGLAAALIFASQRGFLHRSVFVVTVLMAGISYMRLISFYADEYLPYRTIFG